MPIEPSLEARVKAIRNDLGVLPIEFTLTEHLREERAASVKRGYDMAIEKLRPKAGVFAYWLDANRPKEVK